jgi:Ice-binding-like
MKTKLLPIIVTVFTLFSFPNINVAQVPNLGSAANFVLFTINGAVTNTGVSQITGDIGTNSGLIAGFGTSSVTGSIDIADAVTAQCSTDLMAAYNQLNATTVTSTHIAVLGNGETLNAGVYSIAAARDHWSQFLRWMHREIPMQYLFLK